MPLGSVPGDAIVPITAKLHNRWYSYANLPFRPKSRTRTDPKSPAVIVVGREGIEPPQSLDG
jgi:hypothetical protein